MFASVSIKTATKQHLPRMILMRYPAMKQAATSIVLNLLGVLFAFQTMKGFFLCALTCLS